MPRAAGHMLLSALAFSLMTLFVKLAGTRLPTQEVVVARALLTLLFTLMALWRAGVAPLGSKRPLLWLRGVTGSFALMCVYYAVTHLPLAEATVLVSGLGSAPYAGMPECGRSGTVRRLSR